MNTLDDELIGQLRADLDALTAGIADAPPLFRTSVSVASVVAMPPRRDRRRVLVLPAAMIALIAGAAVLVTVRDSGGPVSSTDSPANTAALTTVVVTAAPAQVVAHPIPPIPEGWDLVEWGNVRLALPPDLSPFHTGNGCAAHDGDLYDEIMCGDESVRISSGEADAVTDEIVNGLTAARIAGDCAGCVEVVLPELASTVAVRLNDATEADQIMDTIGPSGQWRFGNEARPFPPAIWQEVTFEGASIRVPTEWSIQTVAAGEPSPCPAAVIPNTVLLDSGVPSDCDEPLLTAPNDGVRMYVADAPLPTRPGWPEWTVGSGRAGASFVVARVGFGTDPSIGSAILSSLTDVTSDTSTTYPNVPLVDLPYLAVGESVMLGAKPNMDANGIRTVAEVSKDVGWEIQQLQLARSKFNISRGVVVQLGTNGTVTREQYDAVLAEVSDVPLVVVMTVKAPRPWIAGNNEIIRSLPQTHPNVVVLDWEARSAEVADHLSTGDGGVHLGDDVAKAFFTNLILEAVGLPG
jgi:hypothetical protein